MALLTRAQIDEADDTAFEDVPVSEWGGEVRLVGMSGTDRNAYQTSLLRFGPDGKPIGVNMDNRDARLLARCLVDEDGQPLYTLKDVAALGAKNGAVIERLAVVARRLSGLGERAVEEAEGNSGPAQSGSSTSA
ncbi:hypothetical protein ACFVU3_08120 [Streptomyces sp. NPDC058052]|uniref:hypothetical protein n=1 Tax=Streptomyces sp. NPDC058052 TaxID=3346316 RepID=UPI0036E6C009